MKNEVIKAHILYLDQEFSSPLILTQTVHFSEKAAIIQWEIHVQALTSASSRPETEDIHNAQGIAFILADQGLESLSSITQVGTFTPSLQVII